jgi:hypothetical protein
MQTGQIGSGGSGAQPRAGAGGSPTDVPDPAAETPRQRSERYLGELGLPVKPPPDVDAMLRLLEPICTSTGKSRRRRLENCGVAYPAIDAEGRVCWERRGCKDRFCVECSAALSRQRTAAVREFWAGRLAAGARGVFFTLTQPKIAGESTRDATGRALATWRTLANARAAICDGIIRHMPGSKATGPAMLVGGLRGLELTARKRGQRIGDYEVRVGGIHAHLHLAGELAPDVAPGDFAKAVITAWTSIAGASPGAQDVQIITDANLHEACKYATNFEALADLVDVAPSYARDVVLGLHGRRLVDCWGTWRGILKPKRQGLHFGDRSIASLVMDPGQAVRFETCSRTISAMDILGELAGGALSFGALRKADKEMARELIRAAMAGELEPIVRPVAALGEAELGEADEETPAELEQWAARMERERLRRRAVDTDVADALQPEHGATAHPAR